jgi:hypothetical protein
VLCTCRRRDIGWSAFRHHSLPTSSLSTSCSTNATREHLVGYLILCSSNQCILANIKHYGSTKLCNVWTAKSHSDNADGRRGLSKSVFMFEKVYPIISSMFLLECAMGTWNDSVRRKASATTHCTQAPWFEPVECQSASCHSNNTPLLIKCAYSARIVQISPKVD